MSSDEQSSSSLTRSASVPDRGPVGRLLALAWRHRALCLLATRSPSRIYTCVLMAKSSYASSGGPPIDFVGFEAPDAYVIGYGLDAGQLYRNLPAICVLEP